MIKESIMSSNRNEIVRQSQLKEITGLSPTTIWRLERRGEFPPRRKLTSMAVGWLRLEIDEWVVSRQNAWGNILCGQMGQF
jgi:prophage regulatory protein